MRAWVWAFLPSCSNIKLCNDTIQHFARAWVCLGVCVCTGVYLFAARWINFGTMLQQWTQNERISHKWHDSTNRATRAARSCRCLCKTHGDSTNTRPCPPAMNSADKWSTDRASYSLTLLHTDLYPYCTYIYDSYLISYTRIYSYAHLCELGQCVAAIHHNFRIV